MASQQMDPGHNAALGFDQHKEALTGATTSDPVLIGGRYRRVSVGVGSLSGNAKIQYTLDTVAAVEADAAQWVDWASGLVTVNAADNLDGPVTAVRCVSGANATWYVVASNMG